MDTYYACVFSLCAIYMIFMFRALQLQLNKLQNSVFLISDNVRAIIAEETHQTNKATSSEEQLKAIHAHLQIIYQKLKIGSNS